MLRTLLYSCFLLMLGLWSLSLQAQDVAYDWRSALRKDSTDVDALRRAGFDCLHHARFGEALRYGKQLFDEGYHRNDFNGAVLYSHIIMGQAYTMLGDTVAYRHLMQARLIGETEHQDSALCSIYNGLGLYYCNVVRDDYTALHYLFEGLRLAQKEKYNELQGILLSNVSNIYYLKNDTTGLKYAEQAYELGHEMQSPYLIYIGASTTAYMQYLAHRYNDALRYIKEAEFMMVKNHYTNYQYVYGLYGLILSQQGSMDEAESYYNKGMAMEQQSEDEADLIFLLYCRAYTLSLQKRYREAVPLLQEALSLEEKHHSRSYHNMILKQLVHCYEAGGDYAKALRLQGELLRETEEMYNLDKEHTLSDLRIQYDSQRQENELRKHKIEILQRARREQLLIVVLVVLVLTAASVFYLYRRKNRLYTTIVRQKQESLQRERMLQERIQSLTQTSPISSPPSAADEGEKYAGSSLTDGKKAALFQQLEACMTAQRLYLDNYLTKEKVADALQTNRTYLSQIINEQTGQTFTQYVNRFRVDEAVRLLGETRGTVPLKTISAQSGFSSVTTFYKVFQASIGMSPKEYREKVLSLQREEQA